MNTNIRRSSYEQPLAAANQISHVLYQHDPLNTLCNVMHNLSEYDIISDHTDQHAEIRTIIRKDFLQIRRLTHPLNYRRTIEQVCGRRKGSEAP